MASAVYCTHHRLQTVSIVLEFTAEACDMLGACLSGTLAGVLL
jgi:hypothetical protein